jgi:hypothetical protein
LGNWGQKGIWGKSRRMRGNTPLSSRWGKDPMLVVRKESVKVMVFHKLFFKKNQWDLIDTFSLFRDVTY